MIQSLIEWDIIYFYFALECDFPILEAFFVINRGDFILQQAQNEIRDVGMIVENGKNNGNNYMKTLLDLYPTLDKHNRKFQISKHTAVHILKSEYALQFVTKFQEGLYLLTWLSFSFLPEDTSWSFSSGDVNIIEDNVWAKPYFKSFGRSNGQFFQRMNKVQAKMLSNYDTSSSHRIQPSFMKRTDISDFEKMLKISKDLNVRTALFV